MREHGLDISKNIVNIFYGGLLDGGANRPNQAENDTTEINANVTAANLVWPKMAK